MNRPAPAAVLGLLTGGVSLLAGCWQPGGADRERTIVGLRAQLQEREQSLAAATATVGELNRQLDAARGLTPDQLQNIYYPERLVIASLTGGYDEDGQPGDDGFVVYIQPVDREGDVVKVAGSARVELYDLANPPESNHLGTWEFDAEQMRSMWFGKFLTNHYTLRCAWKAGPPAHSDITVRVTFVDYLTRRAVVAQAVGKVALPPAQ